MNLKTFLLTFTVPTLLSTTSLSNAKLALADSWIYRNPWTLRNPVVASPSDINRYYKSVVFQGNAEQLDSYLQHWRLKVKLFVQGREKVLEKVMGTGRLWAVCHLTTYDQYYNTVTCVRINSQGRALDPNIERADYRTNVYKNFVASEEAARD